MRCTFFARMHVKVSKCFLGVIPQDLCLLGPLLPDFQGREGREWEEVGEK